MTAYHGACTDCGEIGPVERRMAFHAKPEPVEVLVASTGDYRDVVREVVPERYSYEPRCVDRRACAERVAAWEASERRRGGQPMETPVPAPAHEEVGTWFD